MADMRIDNIRWEDGRHAQRHTADWHAVEDGTEQREVQLHVEPERQYALRQRLVEKRKPVVYHRTTETVNEKGEIVERLVEERDEDKMRVVDHIGVVEGAPTQDYDRLATEVHALVNVLKPKDPLAAASRRVSRAAAPGDPQSPLQDTVANRVGNTKAMLAVNVGLSVIIVGLMTAIGYYLIFV